MARIDKTEDEILRGDPQETPQQEAARETLRERLEALRVDDSAELHSRIYRVNSKGRGGRVFIGSLDDYAEEEYCAETYGPGSYFIAYNWKENGKTEKSTSTFTISDEYGRETGEPVQNTPATLSGFLGQITPEKITVGIGLLKTIREILAPPPPPLDLPALITALNTNKGQNVSDAVLVAAMNSLKEQKESKSISQQLADLRAIKELAADVTEQENNGGDTMDTLLKMGLQLLPGLLQKQNGDFRATGAAVRDNAIVNDIIAKNPDLALKFFEQAAATYGDDSARQLAAGFGYNLNREEPAAQIGAGENTGV
jgi:hypothetical protein